MALRLHVISTQPVLISSEGTDNVNERGATLPGRASLAVLSTNESGNGPVGDRAVARQGKRCRRCKSTFTLRVISYWKKNTLENVFNEKWSSLLSEVSVIPLPTSHFIDTEYE